MHPTEEGACYHIKINTELKDYCISKTRTYSLENVIKFQCIQKKIYNIYFLLYWCRILLKS